MRLKRVHHVAIIASDYEKSKQFYVEILGLTIVREMYRAERDSFKLDLALADGTQIELFSFPDAPARLTRPEACGLRHLAFDIDDMDCYVEELKCRGIEVENVRVDTLTGQRYTFFFDPDGLPLELYEKKDDINIKL